MICLCKVLLVTFKQLTLLHCMSHSPVQMLMVVAAMQSWGVYLVQMSVPLSFLFKEILAVFGVNKWKYLPWLQQHHTTPPPHARPPHSSHCLYSALTWWRLKGLFKPPPPAWEGTIYHCNTNASSCCCSADSWLVLVCLLYKLKAQVLYMESHHYMPTTAIMRDQRQCQKRKAYKVNQNKIM